MLVTGANRGIGFEFAKQYAEKGWRVIGCARQPAEAAALKKLAAKYSGITIEQLDVSDIDSVDALAARFVLRGNATGITKPERVAAFERIAGVHRFTETGKHLPSFLDGDRLKGGAWTSCIDRAA